jgi:hypothetical protein
MYLVKVQQYKVCSSIHHEKYHFVKLTKRTPILENFKVYMTIKQEH